MSWCHHSLLKKDLQPSAILDRAFWINEKYFILRKICINQSNHDRKKDIKGCLKIRKYEISRELSLLNIHLNTKSAIWSF